MTTFSLTSQNRYPIIRRRENGRLVLILRDTYHNKDIAVAEMYRPDWGKTHPAVDGNPEAREMKRAWAHIDFTFAGRDSAQAQAHARFMAAISRALHLLDWLEEEKVRDSNEVVASLINLGIATKYNVFRKIVWTTR